MPALEDCDAWTSGKIRPSATEGSQQPETYVNKTDDSRTLTKC